MRIAEAGLYHYKARAYHPALGRFLEADPIGYAGGMNLYAYVGNDPVNATDPGGYSGCPNDSNCDEVTSNGTPPNYPASAGAVGVGPRFGRVFTGPGGNRNFFDDEIIVSGTRTRVTILG